MFDVCRGFHEILLHLRNKKRRAVVSFPIQPSTSRNGVGFTGLRGAPSSILSASSAVIVLLTVGYPLMHIPPPFSIIYYRGQGKDFGSRWGIQAQASESAGARDLIRLMTDRDSLPPESNRELIMIPSPISH